MTVIKNTVVFLTISLILFSCADSNRQRKNLSEPYGNNVILTYEQRQGKHLYTKYCSVCHGESGKGDGFNAYNLEIRPKNLSDSIYMKSFSDEQLFEAIAQGGRGINKSVLMPAWGNTFKQYQIDYLVEYIKIFSQPKEIESGQE